jgi:hypothetical protein
MKLFEKQGMRNGIFWVPTDEARKDNTLIYFLVHESPEAADRSWKAFQADPEWIKVRDASEAERVSDINGPYRWATGRGPGAGSSLAPTYSADNGPVKRVRGDKRYAGKLRGVR